MAWAVKQKTRSSKAKLILLMIANYADENGKAYPSQAHIAKICICSVRSVIRHIQELSDDNFIVIKKEKNNAYGYNSYILQMGLMPKWHMEDAKIADNTQVIQINRFDEFWKIAPRKIAKKKAKSLYSNIIKKGEATEQQLISGMERYAESVKGTDPKFIVHPTTLLNQGRWDDEIDEKKKNSNFLLG